jgi:hypothetical protein
MLSRDAALAGAAVGNFDGSGKKCIAVLDSTQSIISLLELVPGSPASLQVVSTQQLVGDLARPQEWVALVAANLDHGAVDELAAARHVSDNRRPTIVAFKWSDSTGRFGHGTRRGMDLSSAREQEFLSLRIEIMLWGAELPSWPNSSDTLPILMHSARTHLRKMDVVSSA